MHGCSSTSVLIVNAEAGSMGGVIEGVVGTADKFSPKRAAIEKVQAELRQEYDVREERKRELEFLEKGGNPLDFEFGNATSFSVPSTSFTDQHPDQLVASTAKDSFAFTASPPGDSVESSGRPGAPPCRPISSDNPVLFDGEHELSEDKGSEGKRDSLNPRSNIVQPEQSSEVDVCRNAPENGDSSAFGIPRKAYRRRFRTRPNRDGIRLNPTDASLTRDSHGASLPSRHCSRYLKGFASDAKDQNIVSNCNSKPISLVNGACDAIVSINSPSDMELDSVSAAESTKERIDCGSVYTALEASSAQNALDEKLHQQTLSVAAKTPIQLDSSKIVPVQAADEMTAAVIESLPNMNSLKVENQGTSCPKSGFKSKKLGLMSNDAHNSSPSTGKGLDSESSSSQTSLTVDENNGSEKFAKLGNVDSNGDPENPMLLPDYDPVVEGVVKDIKEIVGVNIIAPIEEETASACYRQVENGFALQPEEGSNQRESTLKAELNDHLNIEGTEDCGPTRSGSERKSTGDNPCVQNEISSKSSHQDTIDTSVPYLTEASMLPRVSSVSIEAQTSEPDSKLKNKIDEDSILKEARIIEAKRKRIMELCTVTSPTVIRRKSQWDYVLEEMAWLANDFAQERLWKMASAAQVCRQVAFTCQSRKQGKSSDIAVKKIAHTLAIAVTEFWHAVQEKSEELLQQSQKGGRVSIQAYAVRFLKYNNSNILHDQAKVPLAPAKNSDPAVLDLSWVDNLTEENLFYTIPPGAMETYRKSIESHVAQYERTGSSVREEVETSAFDATADFDYQDNAYDEDEGETSTFGMSGAIEGSKSSGLKKRKHVTYANGARAYEMCSEIPPMQFGENRAVNQQSSLLAKRPGSSLNVVIPTKRVRTASRRVISPFNAGTSGFIQPPNKTDTSSGDTNSFQDDQSTLHGGLLVPNSVDNESAEVSTKPKKKKKARHLNVAYEERWQVDSSFQHDQFQRDRMNKRAESYQLESNGSSGLLGQPATKKLKIIRHPQDNSFDSIAPMSGSVPSPVASQMSNMSNPNKFIKMLGGRDRARKLKALKVPALQQGSGSPWSLFEDQALVVLAHDLGPNWELVSDAINSTLHFKCIFRKAKECKERHNLLMDKTPGDGADSAEDSGSSQPYPSTLPGIPKGSARQLFQRLQGPMEEDTIKSHFEKIIKIGQKRYYRKAQDLKQDEELHSSHALALSQVSPNNLSGGPILTPLDLCDATNSGSSAISNQSAGTPLHPASGDSAALHGPLNMMLGNNFSSFSGPLNSPVRDGRHAVPRPAPLPADEQQRMQHYNHMISGRSIPQTNISAPGALPGNDRGVRVRPGGHAMGMVSGVNGSMQMARPGLQGLASTAMVNSGSVVTPGLLPATVHSGVGSGQGNSIPRPRESLHMMRPAPRQDSPRAMMVPPDLQIAGHGHVASHFGGLSCSFPNQSASPSVTSYSMHHQPSNPISPQQLQVLGSHHQHLQGPASRATSPQQQAYGIRLVKERQLQRHRYLQQQSQQQFSASNPLMPHVQTQSQLPISAPMQNSSHVQPQTGSPPVSLSPSTTAASVKSVSQQKHPASTQGLVRNQQAGGSGLTNQVGKQQQKQHQQFLHNRQHPQQRQLSQTQQVAKVGKGVERGISMMHQRIPVDPSVVNGVVTNPGNQCSEKGEPSHLMQGQGLYTGSAVHAVQPTRQYMSSQSSNHPLPQQKFYSGQASPLSKQLHQMKSDDNISPGHVRPVAPGFSAGHQSAQSFSAAGSNNQQAPSHQMLANQNQPTLQGVAQPNRQINVAPSNNPQVNVSSTDQHPTSSSVEMDTMPSLPQTCNNAANVVQVLPASSHEWQASEPQLDPNALNSTTNPSSLVSTTPNSSESLPQTGQGIGQRPAGGLPPSSHNVSTQWQEPPSQVPKAHSPVLQP